MIVHKAMLAVVRKCSTCGGTKPVSEFYADNVEYKTPITRVGATNGPENLCCACGTCNDQKKDKTIPEFIAYQLHLGRYVSPRLLAGEKEV